MITFGFIQKDQDLDKIWPFSQTNFLDLRQILRYFYEQKRFSILKKVLYAMYISEFAISIKIINILAFKNHASEHFSEKVGTLISKFFVSIH